MASSIYYHERPDAPLFTFNGEQMPYWDPTDYVIVDGERRLCVANPARGYLEKSEQLVVSSRNAEGQVVAQPINRRIRKFDSLKWPLLTRAQVNWLKKKVANFEVLLGYFDDEDDKWVQRRFYFGDMSCEPIEWEVVQRSPFDSTNIPKYYKRPSVYKDISVNIIDMGF